MQRKNGGLGKEEEQDGSKFKFQRNIRANNPEVTDFLGAGI